MSIIEKYIDSDGQELTKKTLYNGDILYENKQGQKHRLDGPSKIYPSGTEFWYRDGKRHREDGPAWISYNGCQAWWKDGQKHRLDGPAIVYPDGKEEYWINGRQVSKKEIDLLWIKKQVGKL